MSIKVEKGLPKESKRTLDVNVGSPKENYGDRVLILPDGIIQYGRSNVLRRGRRTAKILFNLSYATDSGMNKEINVGAKLNKLRELSERYPDEPPFGWF
jgi:hypothetical protein